MQVNVARCRTMQERMFPIGTNPTQADRTSFRRVRSGNRVRCLIGTGDVGDLDQEKPFQEPALTSTVKIVPIQLADFHNNESGQCNASARRLADECQKELPRHGFTR